MKFRTNFVIKIIGALVTLLFLAIALFLFQGDHAAPEPDSGTAREDADRPEHTLARLTAELNAYQQKLDERDQRYEALKDDYQALANRLDRQDTQAVDREQWTAQVLEQVTALLPDAEQDLAYDIPAAPGLGASAEPAPQVRRYRSLHLAEAAGIDLNQSYTGAFDAFAAPTVEAGAPGINAEGAEADAVRPYITINANATLWDATTLSTLVGRVPVNGDVADPAPFKAILSGSNLAANGHTIPGLRGTIISGNAIGDGTLSCVYGVVTSLTFIFADGAIVTYDGKDQTSLNPAESAGRNSGLGWLSDRHGNQCIPGRYYSNLPRELAMAGVFGAAAGAADAFVSNETQSLTSLSNNVTSRIVTGNRANVLLGGAARSAVEEVASYFKDRQPDRWDSVVIRAGSQVVVHINQNIAIDHDPKNRKIHYAEQQTDPVLY